MPATNWDSAQQNPIVTQPNIAASRPRLEFIAETGYDGGLNYLRRKDRTFHCEPRISKRMFGVPYKLQYMGRRGILVGLGCVLDQAIYVTKDNFARLYPVMLALHVPVALAYGFWVQNVIPVPPANPTPQQSSEFGFAVLRQLPLFYLALVGNVCAISFTNSLMIPAVSRLYLGQTTTMASAMRYGIGRFFPLLIVTFLFWIPCIIGTICCFVPGAVYFILFGLSQNTVMNEKISGLRALGRSMRLIRHDWLAMIALSILLFVIMYLMSVLSILIPQLHLRIVVGAFLSAGLQLWFTVVWLVFYYSCRCGVEYFDLYYLAESIVVPPAVAELSEGVTPFG